MATKVIHTILSLKDNMSGGLIKAAKNTKGVSKEMVSATRAVVAFKNKAVSAVGDVAKAASKAAAGGVAALTAGFLAMDSVTQEYRVAQGKLNTAYEAAGYSAQTAATAYGEFYKILGDTDTATEASQLLSKLAANEEDVTKWTRIAAGVNGTFGDSLPIEGLIESTNETAKVGQVTGVLADALNWAGISEDKFNEKLAQCSGEGERNQLLMGTLSSTYEGAADAFYRNNKELVQARANQTALNNVTAKLGSASQTAKNGLMQLLGVQSDGSLRAGSALEWLSGKADLVMSKFQQWSQDGTITRLSQQFDQQLSRGLELASSAFQFLQEHGNAVKGVLAGVGTAIAAVKILTFASNVTQAVKTAALFGKTLMALAGASGPIGWVILAIAGVCTAVGLLVANWDTVKATALTLRENVKTAFAGIRDAITGAFDSARAGVGNFFTWIGEKLAALDSAIESIPIIGSLYTGVKGAGSWVMDRLQGNALGTSYFSGGLTRINERGGEIINLPGGTQIIPHDLSSRMTGGRSITVNVTVQGNVIGNAQYADSLGQTIVQRILQALDNS